jgi:hypothetical protein
MRRGTEVISVVLAQSVKARSALQGSVGSNGSIHVLGMPGNGSSTNIGLALYGLKSSSVLARRMKANFA